MSKFVLLLCIIFLFVACGGGGSSSPETTVPTDSITPVVPDITPTTPVVPDTTPTTPVVPDTTPTTPVVPDTTPVTPITNVYDINVPAYASIPLLNISIDPTWNIQLQGTINEDYNVDMYEIDLFDSSYSLINRLKSKNIKVICYFNAGAWEDWRSDASSFISSVKGTVLNGYDDEKWLDISSPSLIPIMQSRLDLAVLKGCDGVDPDNMDGYTQNSGFTLSYNDQLAYNRFIANESRARGLSVALKNDLAQIDDLVDYYDFAVNEECFEYNECDLLDKFIEKGKPVFNIEYKIEYQNNINNNRSSMCQESNNKHFSTLVLDYDLKDSLRFSCK